MNGILRPGPESSGPGNQSNVTLCPPFTGPFTPPLVMEASAFLHRCVSLFIRDFRTSTAGFRMTRQRDDGAMKIGIALRSKRAMSTILAWTGRDLHRGTKEHQ